MTRGLCAITGSFGAGVGQAALLVRFKPAKDRTRHLREWLLTELPRLPSTPGLGSAHLFEAAATPPSTKEQRIRGADSTVDWAVLVTGYDVEPVADLARNALSDAEFRRQGAIEYTARTYSMGYSLTHRELSAAATNTAGLAAAAGSTHSQ
jgi:hypothetical protein